MAAKLSAPVDVQIELTQACNWLCRHCYNYWRSAGATTKPGRHLSCEDLSRIVQELTTNQVPSITDHWRRAVFTTRRSFHAAGSG